MEAVVAFGLASNILQVVDFASNIVSRGHKLYNSADGRIEEHSILDAVLENLTELYDDLQRTFTGKESRKTLKSTPTELQLIRLKAESEQIIKELRASLSKVQVTEPHRTWQSLHQALRSVSTDKEIARLTSKLESIRKQVDTAILVSLR
jgi:hypothetical protein